MAYFDEDDDNEFIKKAPQIGPAAPSLADRYNTIAADTGDIATAKKDAARQKMMAGIIEGLSTAFAGPQKTNSSFYNGLRAQADRGVKDAEASHQRRLSDLLTKDKLEYQDKQRQQADQKFGFEVSAKDPSSPAAKSMRLLLQSKYGMKPEQLEGLSYDQQKALLTAASKKSGNTGSYQTKAVFDPATKKTKYVLFNTATGAMAPTDQIVGYTPAYDTNTSTIISKTDPSSGAIPVMAGAGQSLADVHTQLGAERAGVNKEATHRADNLQQVKEAVGAYKGFQDFKNTALNLYNDANKNSEFMGPVMGRVGEAAHAVGLSTGAAADKFDFEVKQNILDQAHKIFGARMTDPEMQRINSLMPTSHDTPDVITHKLGSLDDMFRRKLLERQVTAGQEETTLKPGFSAPQSQPTTPAPETNTAPQLSPEDQQALDWAKANPEDPRAKQIIQHLTGQ